MSQKKNHVRKKHRRQFCPSHNTNMVYSSSITSPLLSSPFRSRFLLPSYIFFHLSISPSPFFSFGELYMGRCARLVGSSRLLYRPAATRAETEPLELSMQSQRNINEGGRSVGGLPGVVCIIERFPLNVVVLRNETKARRVCIVLFLFFIS